MTQLTGVHLAVEEVSLAWLLAESPDTLGGAPPCGAQDTVTEWQVASFRVRRGSWQSVHLAR